MNLLFIATDRNHKTFSKPTSYVKWSITGIFNIFEVYKRLKWFTHSAITKLLVPSEPQKVGFFGIIRP